MNERNTLFELEQASNTLFRVHAALQKIARLAEDLDVAGSNLETAAEIVKTIELASNAIQKRRNAIKKITN